MEQGILHLPQAPAARGSVGRAPAHAPEGVQQLQLRRDAVRAEVGRHEAVVRGRRCRAHCRRCHGTCSSQRCTGIVWNWIPACVRAGATRGVTSSHPDSHRIRRSHRERCRGGVPVCAGSRRPGSAATRCSMREDCGTSDRSHVSEDNPRARHVPNLMPQCSQPRVVSIARGVLHAALRQEGHGWRRRGGRGGTAFAFACIRPRTVTARRPRSAHGARDVTIAPTVVWSLFHTQCLQGDAHQSRAAQTKCRTTTTPSTTRHRRGATTRPALPLLAAARSARHAHGSTPATYLRRRMKCLVARQEGATMRALRARPLHWLQRAASPRRLRRLQAAARTATSTH
jgi:hypothetical protein